jgi:cytoskeletal protein CcmA (bactofilin family)
MLKKSGAKLGSLTDQDIEGFIAEGTSISGELVLGGGFRIDGRVAGQVRSDATLIVGPPGEIDAEGLHAVNLLVSGVVRGKLQVDERLEIQPGGKVYGEVTMSKPGLVVSPGGLFEGTVHMKGGKPSRTSIEEINVEVVAPTDGPADPDGDAPRTNVSEAERTADADAKASPESRSDPATS